jgi:N-acetylmuramoyl-L-alanine amidase
MPNLPRSIWVFGKQIAFNLQQANPTLQNNSYLGSNPNNTWVKNQIVLHVTAGNNPATSSINSWTTRQAGAQFIVEREEHRLNPEQSYSDVVQAVEDSRLEAGVLHATAPQHSIGIEIANLGSQYNRDSDIPADVDANSLFHMTQRYDNCGPWWYQPFQEGQYRALILLLRALCITFPIPRVFLGSNGDAMETLRTYGTRHPYIDTRGRRRCRFNVDSTISNFQGILSHCNITCYKACGGPALNRNRLYRGITDEWWLPVDIDESERGYYTGPFSADRDLFYVDGFFAEPTPFNRSDMEAIQQTKSYFNLNGVDSYFHHVEGNQGGYFPIGRNGCWHGGVHFIPSESKPRVYAAASGTIVAARIGTIPELEDDIPNQFGSPRFVLIRHAVYLDTHEVQLGGSTEQRLNYSNPPLIVFSLYMHLAAFPVDGEGNTIDDGHAEFENHPEIPEWYKIWRNTHSEDISSGQVFNPEIEVMVGDHLGSCGRWYRQSRCLHFEIISGEEIDLPLELLLSGSEVQTLVTEDNSFYATDFQSEEGRACDRASQSNQYDQLRNHVCHHRSEWAVYESDLITIRSQLGRSAFQPIYENIQRLVWYHRARRVWSNERSTNPLAEELLNNLPGDGRVWHYHPITFMCSVNNQLRELQGDFAGGHMGQAVSATDLAHTAVREVGVVRDGDVTLETRCSFEFSV